MQIQNFEKNLIKIKLLTYSKIRGAGRNFHGRIVVRGRGGGIKNRFIFVDFFRAVFNIPSIIRRIDRDAFRTGFIFLVCYETGFLSYFLGVATLKKGNILISYLGWVRQLVAGVRVQLKYIPVGFLVNSLSLYQYSQGQLIRSAGVFGQVLKHIILKKTIMVLIRLPSKELRLFNGLCFGTIGIVSNGEHILQKLKKAGDSRQRGWRPIVRGVAKNPVDHPHGGGQGKTSGGRCSVSPWSVLTKGYRTRIKRKKNGLILVRRFNN